MRAVIYARYSSALQHDVSIEDQVRSCKAWINKEGWTFVTSYTDHAISGSIRQRPGYQKLLEDVRSGEFDVVVLEALDRLSRDQEDVAALYKHLSFAGVKLITIGEGEISELHVGLKGAMNALFLKDLRVKVKRGLEGRVRQGRSGPRPGLRLRCRSGARFPRRTYPWRAQVERSRGGYRMPHLRGVRRWKGAAHNRKGA